MPLPDSPESFDWAAVYQTAADLVARLEPAFSSLLPYLTVLCGLALLGYLLAVAAVNLHAWWALRRRTRVNRLLSRFRKIKARIAGRAQDRRVRLAGDRQRRNLMDLAALVEGQLKAVKRTLPPATYKRAHAFVATSLKDLDFDRLYTLHHLLSQTDAGQRIPRLESLLRQAR